MAAKKTVTLRRNSLRVYLAGGAVLLLLHAWPNPVTRGLEAGLRPMRSGFLLSTRKPRSSPEVRILELPEEVRGSAPALAGVLRELAPARPGVVGVAFSLAELAGAPGLGELAAAVGALGKKKVVLAARLEEQKGARLQLSLPPASLREGARVGYEHALADGGGRLHSLVLRGLTRDSLQYGFALDVARVFRGFPAHNILDEDAEIRIGPPPGNPAPTMVVPVDGDGALWVNPLYFQQLARTPWAEVPREELLDSLAGKVVLLAAPRPGPQVTAADLDAAAVAAILHDDNLRGVPAAVQVGAVVLPGLIAYAVGAVAGVGVMFVTFAVLLGLWWWGAATLLATLGMVLPLVRPSSLLVFLFLAGYLRHRYRPVVGVLHELSSTSLEREAEAALKLGIRLLSEGKVEESIKYFQKIADAAGSRGERGRFFLALVLLRRGNTEAASTLIEAMDFGSLAPQDAYTLADELEQRGQLGTACTLFEKLGDGDTGFRDSASRIENLRGRLSRVSEEEIALSLAKTVIHRRFKEIQPLGSGGMGFVFQARDSERGDIQVALKTLSPSYANHGEIYKRFVREARGVADLEHPYLIRVYDVFEMNLPYYSMEFLQSLSLKEIAAATDVMPAATATRLMSCCCDALAFAHSKGVVHRDLKPENIMLDDRFEPRIIDFGIAKFMHDTQITATGQHMGTPLYMSPEQIRGEDIDHRTDVYSLGIVLHELVYGAPPFELMGQHLSAPVPAPPAGSAVPAEIHAVILRALEKDPEARFPDMAAMKEALDATQGGLA